MAFVYWLHIDSHSDITKEGYIGFSSRSVEKRYKEHKALTLTDSCPNYPVYNAIKKYGDDVRVTTLLEASDEYCLDIEQKLRPEPNIGWNVSCGGTAPMLGKRHSPETCERLRIVHSCPTRRKASSERMKAIPIWEHGSADISIWSNADSVYDCYAAHTDGIGPVLLARAFNLPHKALEAMLKHLRKGWIPQEDSIWVAWKKANPRSQLVGWLPGDALIEPATPVLTDAIRASRGLGGKGRVWTDEMREHLRALNVGKKHTDESRQKMSAALKGCKFDEDRKESIRQRLASEPWTNATAVKENWLKAEYIKSLLDSGLTHAAVLRKFNLDRKSGTLVKIVNKIKAGWNPLTDPAWLAFSAAHKETQ